jgi:hypothetical protein
MIDNDQGRSSQSSVQDLVMNPDGSVDLYYGPTSPKGKEKNWVQTIPGRGWWVYLRFYAPPLIRTVRRRSRASDETSSVSVGRVLSRLRGLLCARLRYPYANPKGLVDPLADNDLVIRSSIATWFLASMAAAIGLWAVCRSLALPSRSALPPLLLPFGVP